MDTKAKEYSRHDLTRWQFDVTTGALVQDPRVGVTRHDTRIVGDAVQVRLAD